MKNRIFQIRRDAGLNQTEFGKRIGVVQTTIAGYESGARSPSDAVIRSICREYGINELWLREGVGNMKADTSRAEELAEAVKRLFSDRPGSFRTALVSALLRFDPDGPEWDLLEKIYDSIAAENMPVEKEKGPAAEKERSEPDGLANQEIIDKL